MANRCNMQIVFLFLNKQDVIPTVGGHGQRWGMIFIQGRGVSKRGQREELFMDINSKPRFLNFVIIGGNLLIFP
jgi:hypothetical protein